MGTAVLVAVLALMLLSFVNAHAATTNGYRLAGIVAVGKDYMGFLELPGGGQILVRQGSAISGGGRIVALDGMRLRIAFPDRTIDLSLEGSGGPGVASTTQNVPTDRPDDEPIRMLEVSSADLAAAPRTSNANGKRGDAGVEVARRFASLAKLPENARVLTVNEMPVKSADAAIKLVEQSLADGRAVSLKVAAAGGDPEKRVYLMPVDQ